MANVIKSYTIGCHHIHIHLAYHCVDHCQDGDDQPHGINVCSSHTLPCAQITRDHLGRIEICLVDKQNRYMLEIQLKNSFLSESRHSVMFLREKRATEVKLLCMNCINIPPLLQDMHHWNGNGVIFDGISVTGGTGSCQNDNFRCSQQWKLRENNDISVSVYGIVIWRQQTLSYVLIWYAIAWNIAVTGKTILASTIFATLTMSYGRIYLRN